MHRGTVVHFRSDRAFGFIKPDEGEKDLFFHLNDLSNLRAGESEPYFTRSPQYVRDDGTRKTINNPHIGMSVVYDVLDSDRGLRAKPWGPASLYDMLVLKIARRQTFRVVRTTTVFGATRDTVLEPDVLWEGADVDALGRKFPRPRFQEHRFDRLFGYTGSDISNRYEFQMLVNGEWIECDDPRPYADQLGLRMPTDAMVPRRRLPALR